MQKKWLKSYQPHVPETINLESCGTIVSLIENSFTKYPDRLAFDCGGNKLTFAEVNKLSADFASYLQNGLSLSKGDHIALMAPNILAYPIFLVGALRAGLVVVGINPMYTPPELLHQLNDSECSAIVIFNGTLDTLEAIVAETGVKNAVIVEADDIANTAKPPASYESFEIPAVHMIKALEIGGATPFKPVAISQDDLALLQYTGGTTGVSKGAMLTHLNVAVNVVQLIEWFGDNLTKGNEAIVTALPLYHIFGLTFNCFFFMSIGSTNLLITNPRDMAGFVTYLQNTRFTAITGVNTLFNGLLHTPGFDKVDFSNIKFCVGGGTALLQSACEKWHEVTGNWILQAYGLSETAPALTLNPFGKNNFNSSIGLPLSSTEICIMDDQENELPIGETGELCARGPQVMPGYWKREDATAEVMTKDGFFRTGDVAMVDENGFFTIVDRKKDMILVSGFNVYPNEIEDVVSLMPSIKECACIGIPDDKTGEAVKVFAVLAAGAAVTIEEVREHCREHLTNYKIPNQIDFIDAVPKSAVGKILRRDLR